MSLIYVNKQGYADDDPVTWEDAIEAGGFYFSRACYLGIPRPPAILFDDGNPGYLPAMAVYHERFSQAEIRRAEQAQREIDALSDDDREMSLEAADQNLMLVMNRLRELADSVEYGLAVIVDADELDALADMLAAARTCL